MPTIRISRSLLAAALWSLWAGSSQAVILEDHDPRDREALVSLQTGPQVPSMLHAEFWVSQPKTLLVTVADPAGGVMPRATGLVAPPLLLDGERLSPRRCFAQAPGGVGFAVTIEEFAQLVKARQVQVVVGSLEQPLSAEARAPLRELWDRLHPMVQDPGFQAYVLLREGSREAIATLLRGGWPVNRPPLWGRPPLVVVAAQGNLEGVNQLLKAGAQLDATDPHGRSALHHAIAQGHPDLALELLERGASVAKTDRAGMTPLHLAVNHRNALLVRELLGRGASPHLPNAMGMTPLHLAIEARMGSPMAHLFGETAESDAQHPDPGVRAAYDEVLQHLSDVSVPLEVAALLLRFGADPRIAVMPKQEADIPVGLDDLAGLNSLDLAARNDDAAMLDVLRACPLVSPADLPGLSNDLKQETAPEAFRGFQAIIHRLGPAQLQRDFLTRRYQAELAPETAPQLIAKLRLALAASGSMASAEGATVEVKRQWTDPTSPPLSLHARVAMVQEDGVWKIDRFELLSAPGL